MRTSFLALAVLLPAVSAKAAEAPHQHDDLPNPDRRLERLANAAPDPGNVAAAGAAPSAARTNAEVVLRSRLPDLQLERDAITRSPKWISARDEFLTGRNGTGRGAGANLAAAASLRADDPQRVAKAFVNEHAALFGHDASALERAVVKRA